MVTRSEGEILPHSGGEGQKGNRGRSVPRKGRKGKAVGTQREYIPVLHVLT